MTAANFEKSLAFVLKSAGGSIGTKYNISLNGVALTSSATLPGASAGTTGTGGQYN